MSLFPITYTELVIWIILMVIQAPKFETTFLFRIFGFVLGFVAGADCLAGERWLALNDSTGVITQVQFDDGLTPLLSVVMIFGSVIMMIYSMAGFQEYRKIKKEGLENVT